MKIAKYKLFIEEKEKYNKPKKATMSNEEIKTYKKVFDSFLEGKQKSLKNGNK